MEDDRTSTLFGMDGFRVLAVDEHGGSVNVLVELEREGRPLSGVNRHVIRLVSTAGADPLGRWPRRVASGGTSAVTGEASPRRKRRKGP